MNQTVKANLKTFTLGLNEDCQRFGNAKLYTISSNAVSLSIPSSLSDEKVLMVTLMNQGGDIEGSSKNSIDCVLIYLPESVIPLRCSSVPRTLVLH